MNPFAQFQHHCQTTPPELAIVLGSGLGVIADRVERLATIPFRDIPGLPSASVHGHRGCLSLGTWAGRRLLLFEGRVHFYEGHPWDVVVRPIQVAAELGVTAALLTNAAGGIRDDLGPGSLMLLNDHLQWNRPFAYRQPRQASPYCPSLRTKLIEAARSCGVDLPSGVYAAMTGPCYETPAEIRALRACGADAVGMSTAREAETGADLGLQMAAISLITNKGAGLAAGSLNHAEVLETAQATAVRLAAVLDALLRTLTSQ